MEPWLVSEVRISGDIKLISVLASGLPTSEDIDHIIDLEALISPPLPYRKPLDLFIGVFSTANNFKRRMAVRRTWMQYAAVRSGAVAVRFFVGLVSITIAFIFRAVAVRVFFGFHLVSVYILLNCIYRQKILPITHFCGAVTAIRIIQVLPWKFHW